MRAPPYAPLALASPFLDGRMALLTDGGSPRRFAIHVLASHCNAQGLAHGGFLATLSDVAAAYTLAPWLPDHARVLTTSLRIDYVAAVRAGDFLESVPDRLRLGRRSAVVTGAWLCGAAEVVLFSASFTQR